MRKYFRLFILNEHHNHRYKANLVYKVSILSDVKACKNVTQIIITAATQRIKAKTIRKLLESWCGMLVCN